MLNLIAVITIAIVLARAASLVVALINVDADAETKRRHHIGLRGLIAGALTGIAAGVAAAFVNSAAIAVGLLAAGLVIGVAWWALAVRHHAAAFFTNLACSHVPLMALALVTVSSSLGTAGL